MRLDAYNGPEWAKDAKAGILTYWEEVLPFIRLAREKQEDMAYATAASYLETVLFMLREGVRNMPALTAHPVQMDVRFIIPRFAVLRDACRETNDPETKAMYVGSAVALVEKRINIVESAIDDLLTKKPPKDSRGIIGAIRRTAVAGENELIEPAYEYEGFGYICGRCGQPRLCFYDEIESVVRQRGVLELKLKAANGMVCHECGAPLAVLRFNKGLGKFVCYAR